MKCEFCGGDLSLEAANCPYCGQVNKHARQHIKDMKRYRREFEKTKKGVYSATQKYSQFTAKIVIAAVMVVVIGILWYLYEQAYSIHWDWKQANAKRNEKEYSELLDQYLEEERFWEFYNFYDEERITYEYSSDSYGDYRYLCTVVDYYNHFTEEMMVYASGAEDSVEYLCSYLNHFYEYSVYEEEKEDNRQENLDALATMHKDVVQMLCTYCNLTPEEAASLKSMSEAKRTVMIEERMETDGDDE